MEDVVEPFVSYFKFRGGIMTRLTKTSALGLALGVVMAGGLMLQTSAYAKWSFGVLADNQDVYGASHGMVATQTIHQIDAEFIAREVKLVVQVGDQMNGPFLGVRGNLSYAANEAQNLYDQGIGFFPMRGNHEAQTDAGLNTVTMDIFRNLFPQTQGNLSAFAQTPEALAQYGAVFSFPTLPGSNPRARLDECGLSSR